MFEKRQQKKRLLRCCSPCSTSNKEKKRRNSAVARKPPSKRQRPPLNWCCSLWLGWMQRSFAGGRWQRRRNGREQMKDFWRSFDGKAPQCRPHVAPNRSSARMWTALRQPSFAWSRAGPSCFDDEAAHRISERTTDKAYCRNACFGTVAASSSLSVRGSPHRKACEAPKAGLADPPRAWALSWLGNPIRGSLRRAHAPRDASVGHGASHVATLRVVCTPPRDPWWDRAHAPSWIVLYALP